jgi:hypothetical protein
MPTARRWQANLLLVCCKGLWGIEHTETCLIVRLQGIHIPRCVVHDGRDRLAALVRMLQTQHMPQLVQDDAAHIHARHKLPVTEYRLEWSLIGIPA